ncbi:hypothetical protein FACS189413_12520 [Bacteroidia bacterium]|nr:hypothetical protein FACS189413_12520 [Bacteroidia bacterium]
MSNGQFHQHYSDEVPLFGFPINSSTIEAYNLVETTPDIFSFQFGNHRGNFCFGYDHTIHVFNTNHPAGEYKISVKVQNFQDYPNSNRSHRLIFTVTTGDGYIYTFDMGALGRGNSANLVSCFDSNDFFLTPAMEWPLVSIKAPNGREVQFEYGDPEISATSRDFHGLIEWADKHPTSCFSDFYWYQGTICSGYENTKQRYYSVKKITIDNVVIELSYGNRSPDKVYHAHCHPITYYPIGMIYIPTLSKLDSLTVKYNATSLPVKTCTFEYAYSDTTNNNNGHGRPVLFLKKIDIAGEGSYQMDYYHENASFPLISEGTAARMGMLKTLVRPTGGYTQYYYEPHSWAYRVTKDLTHDNKPYLSGSGNFTYTQDQTHIAYSSVYENLPDGSYIQYNYSDYSLLPDLEYNSSYNLYFLDITSSEPAFIDNFYAQYDSRHRQRGKLISKKHYSNQDKLVYSEEYKYDYTKQLKYIPTAEFAYSYVYISKLFVDDYPLCQIVKTRYPTDNNSPFVQTTTFAYNDLRQFKNKTIVDSNGKTQITNYRYPFEITDSPDTTVFKKMTAKNIISDNVEKTVSINGLITSGEYRKFNEMPDSIFKPERIDVLHLQSSIAYEALYPWKNTYHRIRLFYMFPTTASEQLPIFINPEKMKIKLRGNGNVKIKNQNDQVIYDKTFNTTLVEEEIELAAGQYRIVSISNNYLPLTSFELLLRDKQTSMQGHSNLYPEAYYKYDVKGNVIEAKAAGSQITTVYLWGYNYQYPIAEIQGANYEQVVAAVQGGQATLNNIATSYTLSSSNLSKINALRTTLPNALVTTYTYKPLVGRLTETDSRGIIKYYEYDAFERLQAIKDENGSLLEHYDYNYKNEE